MWHNQKDNFIFVPHCPLNPPPPAPNPPSWTRPLWKSPETDSILMHSHMVLGSAPLPHHQRGVHLLSGGGSISPLLCHSLLFLFFCLLEFHLGSRCAEQSIVTLYLHRPMSALTEILLAPPNLLLLMGEKGDFWTKEVSLQNYSSSNSTPPLTRPFVSL
jgi:hypothetical protein